jgi:hypothetical protein
MYGLGLQEGSLPFDSAEEAPEVAQEIAGLLPGHVLSLPWGGVSGSSAGCWHGGGAGIREDMTHQAFKQAIRPCQRAAAGHML